MMKLYSYFRSSTSYRVRIALNLKEADYEIVPINLLEAQQRSDEYLAINPLGGVPAMVEENGFTLCQSMAMIDYIDHTYSGVGLYPENPQDRAIAHQIACSVAEDIHPLINLKVQKYLSEELGADDAAKKKWYARWSREGMAAAEKMIERYGKAGDFALGAAPSIADICIVPHLYSMRRMGESLDAYPLCRQIERNAMQLDAFIKAAPESQPDAIEGLEAIHGINAPFMREDAA
jgi:maleylpyruvate isomerase